MKHLLTLAALLCVLCGQGIAAESTQPTSVFLLIDDLGYADCGFNGGKDIHTPSIDNFATDIGEKTNPTAREPERVATMRAKLDELLKNAAQPGQLGHEAEETTTPATRKAKQPN